MPSTQRYFNETYQETAQLANGLCVVLRPVRPSDKDGLVSGLARMSPQSRYLRFFTNKSQFTAAELRYLTEVDGENHFALAALRTLADGSEDGIGIARFVRLRDEPAVAEAAIAVVDEFHRNGLGRLLFLRLAAAARERGIERIRSEILPENRAIRAIIRQLATGACEHHEGGVVTVEASLPAVSPAAPPDMPSERGPNYRLLALAATNALELRPTSCSVPPSVAGRSGPKGPANGSP